MDNLITITGLSEAEHDLLVFYDVEEGDDGIGSYEYCGFTGHDSRPYIDIHIESVRIKYNGLYRKINHEMMNDKHIDSIKEACEKCYITDKKLECME